MGRMERLRETGKADEEAEAEAEDGEGDEGVRKVKEKNKARGKGGGVKRYLQKKRQNVIDPNLVSYRPFVLLLNANRVM